MEIKSGGLQQLLSTIPIPEPTLGYKIKSLVTKDRFNLVKDFKAKKITKRTQILHLKVLTKKALKILDALHIITSNNHVIYKQQEKGNTMI